MWFGILASSATDSWGNREADRGQLSVPQIMEKLRSSSTLRDVELIAVRQYHRSWVSRSGRCHRLSSSPDGGHPSCTETGGSLQGVHAMRE